MLKQRLSLGVSVFIGVLSVVAADMLSPLAASQRDRARKRFSQGELHFEAGRYDAALSAYKKAFTLSNLRGFLLTIGHCYARLGNIQ